MKLNEDTNFASDVKDVFSGLGSTVSKIVRGSQQLYRTSSADFKERLLRIEREQREKESKEAEIKKDTFKRDAIEKIRDLLLSPKKLTVNDVEFFKNLNNEQSHYVQSRIKFLETIIVALDGKKGMIYSGLQHVASSYLSKKIPDHYFKLPMRRDMPEEQLLTTNVIHYNNLVDTAVLHAEALLNANRYSVHQMWSRVMSQTAISDTASTRIQIISWFNLHMPNETEDEDERMHHIIELLQYFMGMAVVIQRRLAHLTMTINLVDVEDLSHLDNKETASKPSDNVEIAVPEMRNPEIEAAQAQLDEYRMSFNHTQEYINELMQQREYYLEQRNYLNWSPSLHSGVDPEKVEYDEDGIPKDLQKIRVKTDVERRSLSNAQQAALSIQLTRIKKHINDIDKDIAEHRAIITNISQHISAVEKKIREYEQAKSHAIISGSGQYDKFGKVERTGPNKDLHIFTSTAGAHDLSKQIDAQAEIIKADNKKSKRVKKKELVSRETPISKTKSDAAEANSLANAIRKAAEARKNKTKDEEPPIDFNDPAYKDIISSSSRKPKLDENLIQELARKIIKG